MKWKGLIYKSLLLKVPKSLRWREFLLRDEELKLSQLLSVATFCGAPKEIFLSAKKITERSSAVIPFFRITVIL
jgi:hypothetical protein